MSRLTEFLDDLIADAQLVRLALQLRVSVAARLADCGLELNEQKTRIVYCKDNDRRGSYEDTSFDFLGYTFPRGCRRTGSGSTC
jgi:RNA-directed DNA polymerase